MLPSDGCVNKLFRKPNWLPFFMLHNFLHKRPNHRSFRSRKIGALLRTNTKTFFSFIYLWWLAHKSVIVLSVFYNIPYSCQKVFSRPEYLKNKHQTWLNVGTDVLLSLSIVLVTMTKPQQALIKHKTMSLLCDVSSVYCTKWINSTVTVFCIHFIPPVIVHSIDPLSTLHCQCGPFSFPPVYKESSKHQCLWTTALWHCFITRV